MQRPNQARRQAIVAAAAALFARHPFHEARLDDVAAGARVGKGTLYVYFRNKEDLYRSVIIEGFNQLIERVRPREDHKDSSAWEALCGAVRELVGWATRFPHFFQLMRPGQQHATVPALREKRRELAELIERIIRRGVQTGELNDPRPDLTAQFIPSMVRAAMRFGPPNVGREALSRQILHVIGGGIRRRRP